MRKILVTGGAGFVGSHVAKALVHHGDEITIIDVLRHPPTLIFSELAQEKSVTHIEADLTDRSTIEKILNPMRDSQPFDYVIHCASNSDTRRSLIDDQADFHDGIIAARTLLHHMSNWDNKRLVFFSSQHVYGESPHPVEDQELRPISSYGATKAATEMLMRYYSAGKGFHVMALRCSNIVGKGQRFGVLPDFIEKVRTSKRNVQVLGDGTQRRSFIHTSDITRAIIFLLDNFGCQEPSFEAFNLASTDTLSVIEILEIVRSIVIDKPSPAISSQSGNKGWAGDLGTVGPPITKISQRGWRPLLTSREAVVKAAKEIIAT